MRAVRCSDRRGGVLPGGGCASQGVCFLGGCFWGMCFWGGGGCLSRWGVSQPALRQTHPPREQNDWQTPVKILPCHNFVADGNKSWAGIAQPAECLPGHTPWGSNGTIDPSFDPHQCRLTGILTAKRSAGVAPESLGMCNTYTSTKRETQRRRQQESKTLVSATRQKLLPSSKIC